MNAHHDSGNIRIWHGDALEILRTMPDASVHCCVTSPPYWGLRDYGCEGQLGLESTPEQYVAKMVAVFAEVRRVLRDDGTLWLNIGDSYTGGSGGRGDSGNLIDGRPASAKHDGQRIRRDTGIAKPKDLVGIPWMLAFALRADGWYLRQDIIWSKPNPMPESVTDRCTKAHEYLFLLSKSATYFYNHDAIKEPCETPIDTKAKCWFGGPKCDTEEKCHSNKPGKSWEPTTTRNKRSVWEIATQPFAEAHFATFPEDLIKPCILAGCPAGGTVLDPFGGSMTTMKVARDLNCCGWAIELSADYIELGCRARLSQDVLAFTEATA